MKKILSIILILSTGIAFAEIKADGKSDDLVALNDWAKAGGGVLPSGTIRITDTWEIGAKEFTYSQMFLQNLDGLANVKLFQISKFTKAIEIVGNNTTIWLDNPDTTKAVILYNAKSLKDDNRSGLIEGITLKGKGVGISSSFTQRLRIYNVNFIGFSVGLLLNNATLMDCRNLTFRNCRLAEHDRRCHVGSFFNTSVEFCQKGFEIHSNKIKIELYNASFCNIGLHVAAGDNVIEQAYLETLYAGEAQLLIGDTSGIKVDGNIFLSLTISAPNLIAIKWLKTAGMMSIIGGKIQSTKFITEGKPVVKTESLLGTIPNTKNEL